MASQPLACANADCRVAVDGKCVEGYPLKECPHVRQMLVEDIEEAAEPVPAREQARVLSLASGDALSRAQASALQTRRLARAVGIIGPNNAGKTSLLAGVYDLLQEGTVAGIGFAGSSTLVGFEKVCHDARAASKRDAPHMERTSVGAEAVFFHLDLQPPDRGLVSLFIGDRSGEDYLAAADEISRAGDFFELRRADVVTLLVNGEHLTSSEHRHEAKAVSAQLVDALVEAKALRPGTNLAVVLTKQDAVLASPHAERVDREFNAIFEAISDRHATQFATVEKFVVAACPKEIGKVSRGEGIDRLLAFWVERPAPSNAETLRSASDSERMIDLLDNPKVIST